MNAPLTTFLTSAGEELVVITRQDYDHLIASQGFDEDAGTARIIRETDQIVARGEDVPLPEAVWEKLEAGESPIAVIRAWRGITQTQLSQLAGLTQGYISQIEARRKHPTTENLVKIARALSVPTDLLIAD